MNTCDCKLLLWFGESRNGLVSYGNHMVGDDMEDIPVWSAVNVVYRQSDTFGAGSFRNSRSCFTHLRVHLETVHIA